MPSGGLTIGILEPHLRRYGGIRHLIEVANHLTQRGHDVRFYLPAGEPRRCTWLPCAASIRSIDDGADDALDVLMFNDEPQWFLLDRFTRTRRRVFYALHDGARYGKRCSWEAAHAAVDLQLANSEWTADQIAARTGHRPTVQIQGVDRTLFGPGSEPKRYDVLCTGDDERDWKGTATVRDAATLLGVDLEGYTHKDLEQTEMGVEYRSARVFAQGSWYEGLGMPGLEALACGVPLVTTDNGGAAEYAIDGETALVVPPRDPAAMAEAIKRLLDDEALAEDLSRQGLALVAEKFDWDRRADELAERLDGVVAGTAPAPPGRPTPPEQPELSVVVLAWDNLPYTQAFVESVRQNTDVDYELIIVDNGSGREAAEYARLAADRSVLNPGNLGFAAGMNQGLEAARGRVVAFCNNDTVLPEAWATPLLETLDARPDTGIVVPAVTASNNPVTVRSEPGDEILTVDPFSAPPAAVVYVMARDLADALGGWNEDYEVASGEDVDLAFTAWTNDRSIEFDTRVLVEHKGSTTAASKLEDWEARWAANRRQFLDRWSGDAEITRLEDCPEARHRRNRATARAAAGWMDRFFTAREASTRWKLRTWVRRLRLDGVRGRAQRLWHRESHRLPSSIRSRVQRRHRR